MTFSTKFTRPLADIPNQEGYRFRGATRESEIIDCVVRKYKDSHVVVDENTNELVYYRLYGWFKHYGESK